MAIGNPTQVASWAQLTTSGQTTYTSSAFTPNAGDLVVAVFQNANGAVDPGAPTAMLATGSVSYLPADASVAVAAQAGHLSVWSHYYASSPGSITIAATFAASNYTNGFIYTLTGAASSSWLDQVGTSSSTSTTAMAVTTAGNVAQADEVAFGCYTRGSNIAAPTTWPKAGWTSLTNLTNATRSAGLSIEYINGVTAAATVTADGTLSAATGLTRAVVTYKGAAAAAVPPPKPHVVLQAVNRSYQW